MKDTQQASLHERSNVRPLFNSTFKNSHIYEYKFNEASPPLPRGAAAQRGPWPPHYRGFLITHNDALQSVGLLWTSDQPVAETSTGQLTTLTTDRHP